MENNPGISHIHVVPSCFYTFQLRASGARFGLAIFQNIGRRTDVRYLRDNVYEYPLSVFVIFTASGNQVGQCAEIPERALRYDKFYGRRHKPCGYCLFPIYAAKDEHYLLYGIYR